MKPQKLIILLVTVCFVFSIYSSLAIAEEPTKSDNINTDLIIWDLVLARPAGLISIGIGTTAFVLSLPFTLPSRSVKSTGQKLVMDPIKYTFTRPLGQSEW